MSLKITILTNISTSPTDQWVHHMAWWRVFFCVYIALNKTHQNLLILIHLSLAVYETSLLYPSHTGQIDTKPTSNRQKSSNSGRDRFTVGIDLVLSVWCRFMFRQTNWSGRDLSNMFQRSLPDKLSVVCRLYIGVVSVLSGSVRGRVGLNAAIDGRWFVGLRSVMYRAYVGRPDTDSRPIQDPVKSDIKPNCMESADTFPNQNRRAPNISRTQTECKPITVCGIIPTYKNTKEFRHF